MSKNSLTILLYHGVTNAVQKGIVNFSGKHINLKIFEKQMKFLSKNFDVISMNDVVEIYGQGKGWPKNAVAVTFDDGFQNNYTNAVEVLEKYKIPTTFYVCAGMINTDLMFWVDKVEDCINRTKYSTLKIKLNDYCEFDLSKDEYKINAINEIKKYCKLLVSEEKNHIINDLIEYTGVKPTVESSSDYKLMTWSELYNLKKNKLFTIGGHTLSHEIMTSQNIKKMKTDVETTLSLLDCNLNQKTKHFSYPEGQNHHYNNNVISLLIENGIVCSPSAIDGTNFKEDLFNLKRIMPNFMGREFPFKY